MPRFTRSEREGDCGARLGKPGKQDALIALLKQNTDTVIRTLHGWKTTRLIAAKDGSGVVIYSEWEIPAAVEARLSIGCG
jgi:hypothetical protein